MCSSDSFKATFRVDKLKNISGFKFKLFKSLYCDLASTMTPIEQLYCYEDVYLQINSHAWCRITEQWVFPVLTMSLVLCTAASVVLVIPDQRDVERCGWDADVPCYAAIPGVRVLPRRVPRTYHHQGRVPPPSHHTHLLTH